MSGVPPFAWIFSALLCCFSGSSLLCFDAGGFGVA
jgi:hypothetical protein